MSPKVNEKATHSATPGRKLTSAERSTLDNALRVAHDRLFNDRVTMLAQAENVKHKRDADSWKRVAEQCEKQENETRALMCALEDQDVWLIDAKERAE